MSRVTPQVGDSHQDEESTSGPVEFGDLMNPPREKPHHRVLPWLPNWIKNELVAMIAEFVGTVLFLMFAFGGTNVANVPVSSSGTSGSINASGGSDPSILLFISLSFGFSLTVNAWVFYRISGGLFNPAVSFALALVGAITWLRAVLLTIAQLLGGITAAAIVDALSPGTLNVTVSLTAGMSRTQGVFLEMFLTAELVFTIIMLAAEKHRATYLAPVGIGLSLFIAELWGVYLTGGALNPARAFGPAVVIGSFHNYHWIYWVGPYLGGALAAGFYGLNKYLKFEMVNPGQDDDGEASAAEQMTKVLDDRGLGKSNSGTSRRDGEGSGSGSGGNHVQQQQQQQQQQQESYEMTAIQTSHNAGSRQIVQRMRSTGPQQQQQQQQQTTDYSRNGEPQFALGRPYNDNGRLKSANEKVRAPEHMV